MGSDVSFARAGMREGRDIGRSENGGRRYMRADPADGGQRTECNLRAHFLRWLLLGRDQHRALDTL
jgi:hypothetical protein